MVPMRHEFFFLKDRNIVEVRAFGQASVEGLARLDTELVEHPYWTPGMYVLCDFRELDLKALSVQDTRASSDFVRQLSESFGSTRMAGVVGKEVDFGIARMFEIMTSDGTQLDIKIFRSISEARSWLES